ncbi:MAG TPA: tetratricopeptide repeat protein, partial [Pyrinomonadaceae bacterium]|nr:tetratricopeptide repeat protein [Pyrinomonadaceae bacterium]
MYLRSAFLPLLISVFIFQAQGDLFRRHYEAAQRYHQAGNFAAAEAEFKIILAESYLRLGRIYTAQGKYQPAADALKTATAIRADSTEGLVDLSIAYFHLGQFPKAVEPVQRALAADARNAAAHH